jgi:hypothetical protein
MKPILIDDLNLIRKIAKKKEITLNNDNDSSLIDDLTNNENEENEENDENDEKKEKKIITQSKESNEYDKSNELK